MRIRLIYFLHFFIPLGHLEAQTALSTDTAYDPVVVIPIKPTPPKPKPVPQPIPGDKSKMLVLKNYEPGEFRNPQSLIFCTKLVDEIDNMMLRNDKILSISIKGYADGLVNRGLDFSNENIFNECSKYLDLSKKIDDDHLAILRACEIEGRLRSFLSLKSYFIYVRWSNSHIDIPDRGPSGYDYRKVEVLITYTKRKT